MLKQRVNKDLASLSGISLLGPWSVSLQQDTPLYWLRCDPLEHYLLKCQVSWQTHNDNTTDSVCFGLVTHSHQESLGMDGASLWMEASNGKKVYCVGGNDLASAPVVTREYPCRPGEVEEWELLMQGYHGTLFTMQRKVRIQFKVSQNIGMVALFNSSRGADEPVDAHFANVVITHMSHQVVPPRIAFNNNVAALSEPIRTTKPKPKEKPPPEEPLSALGFSRDACKKIMELPEPGEEPARQPLALSAPHPSRDEARSAALEEAVVENLQLSRSTADLRGRLPPVEEHRQYHATVRKSPSFPSRGFQLWGDADPTSQPKRSTHRTFVPAMLTLEKQKKVEAKREARRAANRPFG
uniref:Uncharacterized protein n=1 Tax=Oxyrrhis marina TaxID=2969 RepID=A0A7S3UIU0_OXYMA